MSRMTIFLIALYAQSVAANDVLEVALAMPLGEGSMTEFRKPGDIPDTVLIHFHGAISTVKEAYSRSNQDIVLVVINFPGLSSAYSTPFANDRELFSRILDQTYSAATGKEAGQWKRVYLSSFSAGYGAVREILAIPSEFNRIDGFVAADSIYAGLQAKRPERIVNEVNMRDFLRFAELASEKKRAFVLSHSAQTTPYASTTETADYLLDSLNMMRITRTPLSTNPFRHSSRARRGHFLILGFEGTSGTEHMKHLHKIDTLWDHLPLGDSPNR